MDYFAGVLTKAFNPLFVAVPFYNLVAMGAFIFVFHYVILKSDTV